MKNTLIETYSHDGEGYNPFLIRAGWQVAQLNYMPEQAPGGIVKMDKHLQTDEVFILLKGQAILIAATQTAAGFSFTGLKMQPGITYNIPVNTWHNIAMDEMAQVIIVEKNDTHLGDFIYQPLTSGEKEALDHLVKECMQNNI